MPNKLALDYLMNPEPPKLSPVCLTVHQGGLTSADIRNLVTPAAATHKDKSEDIKVSVDKMSLSPSQLAEIKQLYTVNSPEDIVRISWASISSEQDMAKAYLEAYNLDPQSTAQLESKWKTVWSKEWGKGENRCKRALLQCNCGYDNSARHDRHIQQSQKLNKPIKGKDAARLAPFEYHSCLAHADITIWDATGSIKRLVGYLTHTDNCSQAKMARLPKIPMHPHVVDTALVQLREGASITSVQIKNKQLLERKAYQGQNSTNPLESNFRYEILQTDFSAIYRVFHRKVNGIDVSALPEVNLDNWLNPIHPQFNKAIYDAIFYYAARTSANERLKVCISTPEMDAAAWDLAHNNQIILDGTFGVCTTRILLFICMGIDANNHGVPLALFLFSAPTGNRATHAGYDTRILAELLLKWRKHLESLRPGTLFTPLVAITDTDTKERAALLQVWEGMYLLLCRFHLRQCWKNKRAKHVANSAPKSSDDTAHDFWKQQALSRIHGLEKSLIASVHHDTAEQLIRIEREHFTGLLQTNEAAKKSSTGALAFLDYLSANWMDESLWKSWSQYGRDMAARILKRPSSEPVPSTTNHLESFNGVLKRKYIPAWQRSGRRLRFDVFIHHLILKILPEVFAQRRMVQTYHNWVDKRFEKVSGGRLLQTEKGNATSKGSSAGTQPKVPYSDENPLLAWYSEDEVREGKGKRLFAAGMLIQIPHGRPYEIWASCAASTANPREPNHLRYWLTAHPSGSATCTCYDWLSNGGACKHLRALRHAIRQPKWCFDSPIYPFHFPNSRDEAYSAYVRNRAWYGAHYSALVTPYSNTIPVSTTATSPNGYAAVQQPVPMATAPSSSTTIALPPPGHSCAEQLDSETCLQNVVGDEVEQADEEGDSPSDDEDDDSGMNDFSGSKAVGLPLLKPTAVTTDNLQGIVSQLNSRLQHALERGMPTLFEITSVLQNYVDIQVAPAETPLLEQLTSTVEELASTLSAARSSSSKHDRTHIASRSQPVASSSRTPLSRSTTPPPTRKRKLLPPSPEMKQKRKVSHGTL